VLGVESPKTADPLSLRGKRIMLMEDNDRLYGAIKDSLEDFGCEILGSCARICGPIDVVPNSHLDAALIDLEKLSTARSTAIVTKLQARGVPVVLITHLTAAELPSVMRSCDRLEKPFTCTTMLSGLAAVIADSQRADYSH
jgi:DNA-binding NtrC family response regulator